MNTKLIHVSIMFGIASLAPAQANQESTNMRTALTSAYGEALQFEVAGNGGMTLVAGQARLPVKEEPGAGLDVRLARASIGDMFAQPYPMTPQREHPAQDFDPGRVRNDDLFRHLYGATRQEVAANMKEIVFCGNKVSFNARHGAADALVRVSAELEALFVRHPEWRVYTQKLGGTFAWRMIAGTKRLSTHSFGIAIDLQPDKGHYWRWSGKSRPAWKQLGWPEAIVAAFEKHGFIWGGKWWHYDTFHFEYRPELIAYAKLVEPSAADIAE
jgi:hypothetical protein